MQQKNVSAAGKGSLASNADQVLDEPSVPTGSALPEQSIIDPERSGENQEEHDVDDDVTHIKYRQYLIDRTNGTSKLGDSKPPCSACFVPLPVVWFADYIEQHRIFETLGSFGYFDPSNLQARTICIGLGLICNVVSTILSLYVLFVTSQNYKVVWGTAFTIGQILSGEVDIVPYNFNLRMGLRAMAIETINTTSNQVLREDLRPFSTFCNFTSNFLPNKGETCGECDAVSNSMIFTLYISFFMCFPSITTSVLRLYAHYDCNCQKVFGSFAAVISVAFAMYTFVLYQFRCFRSVSHNVVCYNEEEDNAYWPEDGEDCGSDFFYKRSFRAGPGWICLAISTGLKILDMLFNMAIPTPTICRDREEQRAYETLTKQQDEPDEHEELMSFGYD